MARSPFGWQMDPFDDLKRLQDEVNRLFSSSTAGRRPMAAAGFPAINAYANDDGIAITAELPGVRPEDLEVSALRDTLTLRGTRRPPEEARAYHRRERREGDFARTLSLPFRVDPNRVEARLDNGVLHVALHRAQEDQPRRIQVRAG